MAPAIILMAAAGLVPLNYVQLHAQALLGLLALWPLAYVMWTRPEAISPIGAAAESSRPLNAPEQAGAAR